jgi:eukaryotic-like serine/threonine-protein kinase
MDGRYTILGSIAKGGMATVYLGRVAGSAGFSRLVAIKRLHPDLAAEKAFVGMLVDEARLASQVRHTNVVDTLDLVVSDGAFSLVLEYIEGESLSRLLRSTRELGEPVPQRIAIAILYGVLRGLDAAHEARSEDGEPLGIVHRDVSPQNILIGVDGIPRVIDFGVAKAIGRFDSTKPGEIRGKFSYMSPEQMQARPVTRQVDVYAAGIVLWELLVGRKLFDAEDQRAICAAVLRGEIPPPSTENPEVSPELDAIVLRATARDLGARYMTARELVGELEKLERASDDEVGAFVRRLSAKRLAERQRLIQNAPSAADGRPLEDLVADLARGAVPALESTPELRGGSDAESESETMLASTAGTTPAGRKSLFVVGLALVGILVLLALFLRFRTTPEVATPVMPASVAAAPPAPAVEAPAPTVEPSSPSTNASNASEAPSAAPHEVAEPIANTNASSTASSSKPARKPPRPRPTVDPRTYR